MKKQRQTNNDNLSKLVIGQKITLADQGMFGEEAAYDGMTALFKVDEPCLKFFNWDIAGNVSGFAWRASDLFMDEEGIHYRRDRPRMIQAWLIIPHKNTQEYQRLEKMLNDAGIKPYQRPSFTVLS